MQNIFLKKARAACVLTLCSILLNSCSQGPNLEDKLDEQQKEIALLEKELDSVKTELHGGKAKPNFEDDYASTSSLGYASIKNLDRDFYTTNSFNNGKPGAPKSTFGVGEKVYIWASINAPKSEAVKIKWVDANGNVFSEKSYDVQTAIGYRLYTWKSSFPNIRGNYSVQLFNSQGTRIAGSDFSVN